MILMNLQQQQQQQQQQLVKSKKLWIAIILLAIMINPVRLSLLN